MTNKDDEQMKFAFNNMIDAASQVADIMFLALFKEDPKKAEEIAVAINSNRPRYMLQVRAGGIDLVALDEQNRIFGEPLFSYVKEEEKPVCIN
ncbi:hypothetical protein C8R31_106144 [Nitrosospira sp. Nsp2]|nr:hypothetical protein C8R31_106144 [Nitrosospira sp. Nsp2]